MRSRRAKQARQSPWTTPARKLKLRFRRQIARRRIRRTGSPCLKTMRWTRSQRMTPAKSSQVTAPGDTAVAGHPVIDEEAYQARWRAPQSIYLAHPMQPSLEFLSPEQATLQAAHNHGHLDGVAEGALRKDDAWVKKTITFLLRSTSRWNIRRTSLFLIEP